MRGCMKHLYKLLTIIILSLSQCHAEEKLYFQLDSKDWKIGFESTDEDQSIVEMLTKDEDISSWTELFTIQKFDNLKASADDFLNEMGKVIAPYKDKYALEFKKLDPKEDNLFELSFKPKTDSSDEKLEFNVGRVIKGKNSIYEVRYSQRSEEAFNKQKPLWIEKFKNAYVSEDPKEGQTGQWLQFTDDGVYEGSKKLHYEVSHERVVDSKAGFSISLPGNWLIKDDWMLEKNFDENHLYTIPLIFTRPDFQIYGGVAFYDVKKSDDGFEPLTRYLELYEEHNVESELIGKGEIKTEGDNKGKYILLNANGSVGWITFFEKDNRIYRLEVWTSAKQFKTLQNEMEELVKSFSLIPQS